MAESEHVRRLGRPPRDEVAEGERRSQILEVAGRLFEQRGYAAVSVGEIAAEVGVTKAALYHHFRGKDELYASVIGSTLEAIADAIRRVAALPVSSREKIAILSRIAIMEVQSEADMDSMMRDVAEHLSPAQQERIRAAHRKMEDAYTELMATGIVQGELRDYDPRLLGHSFMHLLTGFVGRTGVEAGYQGRQATVDAVVDLFLQGAAAPAPAVPAKDSS